MHSFHDVFLSKTLQVKIYPRNSMFVDTFHFLSERPGLFANMQRCQISLRKAPLCVKSIHFWNSFLGFCTIFPWAIFQQFIFRLTSPESMYWKNSTNRLLQMHEFYSIYNFMFSFKEVHPLRLLIKFLR